MKCALVPGLLDDQIKTVAMVMKSKATDVESCNLVNLLAQGCGLELACLYELFKLKTGFKYVV